MIATVTSGAVMAVLLLGWGISSIGMLGPIRDSQTAAAAAAVTSPSSVQPASSGAGASTFTDQSAVIMPGAHPVQTGTVVTIPADGDTSGQ
jgi:hypothetical protein